MLAIARALMSQPRLLLLDEPSLGLAPKVIAELFDALDGLRRDGLTLLLVDQMAGLALALADRAYVIEGGSIVASGTAAQIAADPALAKAYLGGTTIPAPGAILAFLSRWQHSQRLDMTHSSLPTRRRALQLLAAGAAAAACRPCRPWPPTGRTSRSRSSSPSRRAAPATCWRG